MLAQTKNVNGKVFLDETPLKNVAIQVLYSSKGVVSSADGSYELEASVGDVIEFSFLGLKPVQIFVEDVTSSLNITMYPNVNELVGVTVTERKKNVKILTQQDYEENKTHLQTSYGMTDLSKGGGTVRFLQGDKLSKGARCLLEVIRGVLPGVLVVGVDPCVDGKIQIRGSTSIVRETFAIYDLDGVVFTEPPMWVQPNQIERIAVLSGVSATIKYGALGFGGVVIVNTKRGLFLEDGRITPALDTARLTDNVYNNDAVSSASLSGFGSKYVDDIRRANNLSSAKNVYKKNRTAISGSYFFVLDVVSHFTNERKDMVFAEQILKNNYSLFQNNPVALKSLAYIYDSAGFYEKSNNIYKEVFILRPQYAQSYLDLARNYITLGEYQKGATMLLRYDYLVEEGFMKADEHFSKISDRELNNLLQLKGKSLISGKSRKKYVLEDNFEGTRLVFEWADSEAEFDLQFVNPENRYAKWEHTLNANSERILQEKQVGHNIEEYLIDNSLKGIWKVNIIYRGNKKLTPTYLKTTVYNNYGSKSQSKELKIFKLQTKGLNQNLLRIVNGSFTVSN